MAWHTTGFLRNVRPRCYLDKHRVGSNLNRIFFIENTAYASGTTIYKISSVLSNSDFKEQNRKNIVVKVMPDPIIDKLNIEIDFLVEVHLLIDLHNNTGKLLKNLLKEEITAISNKKYTFEFPFSVRTYFVDFHTTTRRKSSKITKK